jgi:hypothetical protein
MAVARELARALDPEHTPGLLATTLFVVLNASTLQEAHVYLDEAGLPRLDVERIPSPPAASMVGLGGEAGSAPSEEAEDTDDGPSVGAQPIQEDNRHSRADLTPPRDGADQSEEDRTRSHADGESHAGTVGTRDRQQHEPASAGVPEVTGRDAQAASSSGDHGASSKTKSGRRGRLRSYVLPDSDVEESEATGRSPVDDAGIRRVVALERSEGRLPTVQAHNNPGFDVVSISPTGDLLRYIEVKSTDGPWDEMGVALSPRQLEFARQHPEKFWLYIIEYATDDTRAQVFGIPDVASKIEEYRFDNGWAAVAEHMYSLCFH